MSGWRRNAHHSPLGTLCACNQRCAAAAGCSFPSSRQFGPSGTGTLERRRKARARRTPIERAHQPDTQGASEIRRMLAPCGSPQRGKLSSQETRASLTTLAPEHSRGAGNHCQACTAERTRPSSSASKRAGSPAGASAAGLLAVGRNGNCVKIPMQVTATAH
jgi:hypothetical protein